MDRKVEKKKWTLTKKLTWLGAIAALITVAFFLYNSFIRNTVTIDSKKISFATITKSEFQEYILETGEVVPSRTFFLDAVEGGNITQIFKESGSLVKKGEPILELENANLRLSVLSQESSLYEQINRIRTTRLQLDQNYLSQQKELAEIDNLLQVLTPQYRRDSILFSKQLISQQTMEKTQADYILNKKKRSITEQSFRKDSIARIAQLKQLSSSEASMFENLKGVRAILDNLLIKASIDGLLSTSQLQEGQNVTKGQRIGQVDVVGSYKVNVPIDEIYLSRIKKGLKATTTISGKKYSLVVSYIYPTIEEGNFTVDMAFEGETPQGILSGQSLRLKIELGSASEELMLPVASFYNDTGGNWIFVVDQANKEATKREIILGKKNAENYQILEGLDEGERVIISSYKNFKDAEVVTWK
jgi:HlyD family secretion protein